MPAQPAPGLLTPTILNKQVNVPHVPLVNTARKAPLQKQFAPPMHFALKEVQFSQIARKTHVVQLQVEPAPQAALLVLL
jgi:hypothetical protein